MVYCVVVSSIKVSLCFGVWFIFGVKNKSELKDTMITFAEGAAVIYICI